MAHGKRVFKFKAFDRWARQLLPDAALCLAAREVEAGLWEADLGAGVCKKQIAVPGRGKSGSTRVLIAHQNPLGIFFLVGREKSQPGADFPVAVVSAARLLAKACPATDGDVRRLLDDGVIKEICNGQNTEQAEDQPRVPAR